jgi:phytol kinase
MAAAAWPAIRAPSQCALLLSRSPPSAGFAIAPPPGRSMRRRRLLLGVGMPAVAALAAAVPPAALQDGAVTLFVTAGAYTLVRAFDALTERRLIEQVAAIINLLFSSRSRLKSKSLASMSVVFGGVVLISSNSE